MVMPVLQDGIERKSRKGSIAQGKKNLGNCRSCLFALLRAFHRRKHKDEEKKNNEERGDPHRLADIEGTKVLGVPTDEESNSRGKCPQQKPRPRFEPDEYRRRDINGENVGEKKNFVVAAGRKQQWGRETSCERVGGQDLAVLRPGHVGVPRRHQDHRAESSFGGQQMIKLEGRPQREVESAAADGLQRVGKRMETLMAEAFRPNDNRDPRNESRENTSERA